MYKFVMFIMVFIIFIINTSFYISPPCIQLDVPKNDDQEWRVKVDEYGRPDIRHCYNQGLSPAEFADCVMHHGDTQRWMKMKEEYHVKAQ